MLISKRQHVHMRVVLTAEDLTADQVREARDRWPEWITAERSANALGVPESHTRGGLPIYPLATEIYRARVYIARIITDRWHDASNEHTLTVQDAVTNHPQDLAEVRTAHDLSE